MRIIPDNYWLGTQKYYIPSLWWKHRSIVNIAMRIFCSNLEKFLPKGNLKFLEIGCAPGIWMEFFFRKFGYSVEGIENSKTGADITARNLATLNIPNKIHQADFFKNSINPEKFDVVFSSGFIEHFQNPEDVLLEHLQLLNPGGFLVVSIPNYQGMNLILRKISDSASLEYHNLNIMNPLFFHEMGRKLDLEEVFVGYVGKINLAMFSQRKLMALLGLLVQLILSIIPISFLFPENSKTSPYIMAIYRKKH